MAVRINPCFGCPLRSGCDQREDFAKRVRGLGLRSATFNCAKLTGALSVGTRIEIAAPIRDYGTSMDPGYEFAITRVVLPATIHSTDGSRFACVIDREAMQAAMDRHSDGETSVDAVRFRRTMRHSRIVRFLDEPRRKLCEFGNVITPDGKCDSRNSECGCSLARAA